MRSRTQRVQQTMAEATQRASLTLRLVCQTVCSPCVGGAHTGSGLRLGRRVPPRPRLPAVASRICPAAVLTTYHLLAAAFCRQNPTRV